MSTNQYRKQEEALRALRDLYQSARTWKLSSVQITEQYLQKVMPIVEKSPRYVKSYISGAQRILYEELWEEMEFCYWINGVRHSTWKNSTLPRVPAESMSGNLCGHYWIGTDKAYTEVPKVD